MNEAMQIHTTVIYHSADFDGIFCREIAKKFLGDGPGIQYIGWDFGDAPVRIPDAGAIYVMDLPVDRVFGFSFTPPQSEVDIVKLVTAVDHLEGDDVAHKLKNLNARLLWIDHHKSSIETHPTDIPGYRIDGVSACRLAWQWFTNHNNRPCTCEVPHSEGHYDYCLKQVLPTKEAFVSRKVSEPLAVRMAGEYDVWDKRDPFAEVFQFGLRSHAQDADLWENLLGQTDDTHSTINVLLRDGALLQRYQQQTDANVVNFRSFLVEFEGLKFLALNTARCNSLTFAAKDVPETGHDALMGFFFDGKAWKFSLYHAKHNTGLDLSAIAVRYGGGGHRGACGFQAAFIGWSKKQDKDTPSLEILTNSPATAIN